jgi:hypothetical protein
MRPIFSEVAQRSFVVGATLDYALLTPVRPTGCCGYPTPVCASSVLQLTSWIKTNGGLLRPRGLVFATNTEMAMVSNVYPLLTSTSAAPATAGALRCSC